MNAVSTFALLARWLERGDRDDLVVAIDGLRELDVRLHRDDLVTLVNLLPWKRLRRRERAFGLAPIVWNLVHQLPDQWRPTTHELRTLLALALQVRQQIRDPQRIVGGERGYINLTGLLWWAGRNHERDTFHPRIATIGRFVEDGDVKAFRQNLLNDEADEAQRRQRNVAQRSRRERQRQLRVYDYDTQNLLGMPTAQLARRSAESDTGAVPAYLDSNGRWEYVTPQQRDDYRRMNVDVLRVYVT